MSKKRTKRTKSKGNTKPSPRKRKWCFTLNNYEDGDIEQISTKIIKLGGLYIIGEEVAKTGTPHLQGYIEFENLKAFSTIQKIVPKAHIEPAHGTTIQNIKYCSKDEKYHTNIEMIEEQPSPRSQRKARYLKKYENTIWKEWQTEILKLLEHPPDDRKVIYVYDPQGGNGKSYLTRYLYLTREVVIANGKANDVFNQFLNFFENASADKEIDVVILDLPRGGYVNYQLIEKIKDGLFYCHDPQRS
jgi:hypothetical protein